MIRRLTFLFVIAAGCLKAAPPAATQSDLTADTVTTDEDTGEAVLTGHAEMVDGPFLMTADVIRYNRKTNIATADGHVTMTQANDRLLADSAVYNRTTQVFTAKHLRAGSYPFYIEGVYAEGTATEITIHDASITYQEPGRWQPTIKADTIVYSPHHYLRLGTAHLGLGQSQPVPIMHVHQDLKRPESLNYLSANIGYRGNLGVYADTTLLFPVTENIKAGLDAGLYTNRGVMIGPGMAYGNSDEEENALYGYLKTGYIHDYGHRIDDTLGDLVPPDRAYAEWRHTQQLTDNITIDGEFNYWKDSEIIRDFRPYDYYHVQEPDSFVETVYTGEDVFASAFARYQPNFYNPVQERLPELRLDLPPTALLFGVNERFFGSVAYLVDREPTTSVEPGSVLKSDRLDAFYGLSRPIVITPWLDVTPTVGARLTDYTDTEGAVLPGGTFRALGEVGADANLRASGTFDYNNPNWEIDGLRHLLTPILSWRYIPDANKDSQYIPQIDRQTFSTYLPVLDLGDQRSLDQLRSQNTVRVGINNTLQTRDPVYGSRDLVSLNLAEDFRFQNTPNQNNASDIHADVSLTPARWITINLYDSYSIKPITVREWDTDIILKDGDQYSLRFGTGYVNDHADDWVAEGLSGPTLEGLDNYHIEGRTKLNEVYAFIVRADYDARSHRFTDQAYGIEQVVSNTWRLTYLVTFSEGNLQQSHFGFNIRVDTVRY